jgi:hypothetical protein
MSGKLPKGQTVREFRSLSGGKIAVGIMSVKMV